MKRRTVAMVSAAALVLALVGCGGSDSDALSREDLVSEGNKICKAAAEEIQKVAEGADAEPSDAEVAERLDALATIGEDLNTDLRALEAEDEDLADELDRAIAAQEDQVADIRKATGQAEGGDVETAMTTVDKVDGVNADVQKGFDDVGLSECGSAAGPS